MMLSLLGPNVLSVKRLPEIVAAWHPPIAVVMDHDPAWRSCRQSAPLTNFVGRQYRPIEPDFNADGMIPEDMAAIYCAGLLPLAREYREVFDFWQGPNEPAIESPAAMLRYALFEQTRVQILAAEGFRAAIGTFATGNPPDLSWYSLFLPAIEAARANGGVLALHQYDWDRMLTEDPSRHTAWLGLRHRKVYGGEPSHHWPGLLALGLEIPLVITETGLDAMIIGRLGGWRDVCSADEYMAQLVSYSAELEKDPYVLGAAIFCAGNIDWKWAGYDIDPQPLHRIAYSARPIYRRHVPAPTLRIVDLRPDLPKHPKKVYGRRPLAAIERVVIHHSAVHPKGTSPVYIRGHIAAIAAGHIRRDWPGIAYHYCIGPAGDIYHVNDAETVAFHAAPWNVTTIGICLLGALHKYPPPAAQVEATRALTDWLGKPVVGHKDLVKTQCPGTWWRRGMFGLASDG